MKKRSSMPSATAGPISAGHHPLFYLIMYPKVHLAYRIIQTNPPVVTISFSSFLSLNRVFATLISDVITTKY